MDVYNSVSALVDPKVPAYLMSTVKEADARAAYAAIVDFAGVVKANPITPSSPASTVSSSAAASISAASSKLSAAAYPFMKDIDWTDTLYSKPVPGKTPQEAMKAIDKMIVRGSKMDRAALKEAAMAHASAIQNMDAKGVLTQADFEAINTGLGKAIASAGTAATMDVYNEMAKLAGSSPVPNYLFSKVNPQDAMAAYNGLMEFQDVEFKDVEFLDVVKARRRWRWRRRGRCGRVRVRSVCDRFLRLRSVRERRRKRLPEFYAAQPR